MAKSKRKSDLLDVFLKKHEGKESKSYESKEGGKKRKSPPKMKR